MRDPAAIPTIDVGAANAELADVGRRPLVVDVRERDEFAAVRLPDVALIPMSEFAERHAELPKDRRLLVMCAGGTRSAAATSFLLRSGWTDVANVAGGITAWERAGLPVKHGPVEPGDGDLPG
jgi:rhodanese-related sulfurtransferase